MSSPGDSHKEDPQEFSELIKQRGSIRGRLTIFEKFLLALKANKPSDITSSQIDELRLRLNKLEALFADFDACQTRIEVLCPTLATQLEEREITESKFYSALTGAEALIKSHPSNNNHNTKSNSNTNNNNIKLPIIKLPTFDGNYFSWLEYRDTFQSMIHDVDTIPDINKFHYLRSSLEGSAALVIKAIEFTSDNYQVAWDLLCQRYNNKKILINNHMKALFKIEPISKESHRSLRYLIDIITKNLRALETLGQPVDSWDAIIIYMVSTKLDPVSSNKWEEHRSNLPDLPKLSQFIEFIRNRADILETTLANRSDKPENKNNFHNNKDNKHDNKPDNKNAYQPSKFTKSFVTSKPKTSESLSCPVCSQAHRIIDCNTFKSYPTNMKISEVAKLNLCSNCLRRGHKVTDCRLGSCRLCNEKHNTILHKDKEEKPNTASSMPTTPPVTMSVSCSGQVLLGTALVQVSSPELNHTYLARALLDAGSQSSFMTESLKQKLGLVNRNPETHIISGINNVHVPISDSCDVTISSTTSPFNKKLNCLIIPQITGQLPNFPVNITQLNLPNVAFADPHFYRPADIDMLLGADIFFDILSPEKMSLGPNMPILQSTQLGWVLAGSLGTNLNKGPVHCNFTKQIHDDMTRFWNLEEIPSTKPVLSADEEFCEEHFTKHVQRMPDGRFSVSIPFKESPESLGDSLKMALKRFYNLENRLNKNLDLKNKYTQFIKEYESLGHLTKINRPQFGYYLPHHAVIREDSETTKLRVVFDASAKTTTNKSLNDIQAIGPVVQDDLFSILIRFRQHKFVLSGDIIKMYRQINVDPSQRNFQLILWRDDDRKPIETLQLNTVTYGTASAPFLSTRCLFQLANECPDPQVSEVIKRDFYVDDLLTGASTVDDLAHIHKGVTNTLSSACLPIHKFRTNCPTIFSHKTETESLDLNKEASVLGIRWAPESDSLTFSINVDTALEKITKRTILSNTCKIFDPLGLLSACTVTLKILLQRLWKLNLTWDEPVPSDVKNTWQKVSNNLQALLSLSVPRHVLCSPSDWELHCFVDASQEAYSACVYIRSTDQNGDVIIRLLCAKTRVAPLKTITIPRLELSAALLGARLVAKVTAALRCPVHKRVFWSDSTITLGWIKTQPKLLKQFVCNRIHEIHDLTDRKSWRYVPTSLNPADLASRGIEPNQLIKCSSWWEGPPYLRLDESQWPQSPQTKPDLPEIKSLKTIINNSENNDNMQIIKFENYSSSLRLKRIIGYIYRFIHNTRNKNNKNIGSLKDDELKQSLTYLIKISQIQSFSHELNLIKKDKKLTSSSILQLSPFIDDSGVLRVGGRLNNTDFNFEKKHPVLLDGKHHFTKLLMRAEHLRLLHAGPQLLLASFREQFWPLGGRTLARKITRQCITCSRFRGKTMEPLMGQLPTNRVTKNYPFQICGIDYAGPILISSKKGRGNRISKCYICLFVCYCTKAIHLEIVSDLTSNAFIASLRRFISRRGKPNQINCDNGTNFVGASNELNRVLQSAINSIYDFTAEEGIRFNFNPPYSPTFGGLWEAGVKSAKYHLKRIMGNASLTFEELSTVCTQIEAVLNSRPLTPLSCNPHDLSPLTPGHFLIGRPLTSLPSPPTPEKRLKTRYQLMEALKEGFWKRWHQEYLAELQKKTKWRSPYPELREGTMVIFKEENLPPMKWRIGRVIKTHPGRDGVCRVADFKTYKGIERRALNKVCPLFDEEDVALNQTSDQDVPVGSSASSSSGPPRCLRQ